MSHKVIKKYTTTIYGQEVEVKVYEPATKLDMDRKSPCEEDQETFMRPRKDKEKDLVEILEDIERYGIEEESED